MDLYVQYKDFLRSFSYINLFPVRDKLLCCIHIRQELIRGKKVSWVNNILKDFIISYDRAQADTECPFCLHLGKPTRLEAA